jgi:hypothetical protein
MTGMNLVAFSNPSFVSGVVRGGYKSAVVDGLIHESCKAYGATSRKVEGDDS